MPGEVFIPDILPMPPAKDDLLEKTQALLPVNVRKALESAPPPDWIIGPPPRSAEGTKKHNYAKSVFYTWLDQQIASDSSLTSQFQPLQQVKAEPTSPSTPTFASTPAVLTYAAAAGSSSPAVSSSAVKPLPALKHARSMINTPLSLASTSPDPMRMSSPGRPAIIVEVPAKRRTTESGVVFTSVKKARTISDLRDLAKTNDRSVFSDPTSEADSAVYESQRHVKEEDDEAPVVVVAASSPSSQVKRKLVRAGSVSPTKRRHLESAQQADHTRLENLITLIDDIFTADDILTSATTDDDQSMGSSDVEQIFENTDETWIIRSDMVVRLSKCVTNLVNTPGGKQLFESAFGKTQPLDQLEDAQLIDTVSVESIRRLMQILGRSLKDAAKLIAPEFYDTISTQSALTPVKEKKGKKAKPKQAANDPQGATRPSLTPRRSSRSRSPSLHRSGSRATSDAECESDKDEDEDAAMEEDEEEYSDEPTPTRGGGKRKAKPKTKRGVSRTDDRAAAEAAPMDTDTLKTNFIHLTKVLQIITAVLTTLSVARLPKQVRAANYQLTLLRYLAGLLRGSAHLVSRPHQTQHARTSLRIT